MSSLCASEISAQLPLGLRDLAVLASAERPSTDGARPFGLRFGQLRLAPCNPIPDGVRYDPHRQVAVEADGTPVTTGQGTGSMETTGQSPDGKGSTGNEEWTPDYAGQL